MTEGPVTVDAHRLRRNWFWPLGALLGVVLGAALMGAAPDSSLGVLGGFMVWMCMWIAPITLIRNSFPQLRRELVVASPESLTVGEGEPIAVEDIVEARAVERFVRRGETVVELKTRAGAKLEISLAPVDAYRLLETLGVGAGARRARFRVTIPFWSRFAAALALIGVPWFVFVLATSGEPILALISVPLAIVPVCLGVAVVLGLLRGAVTIGGDGFTTNWYSINKMHRFAEIEGISRRSRGGLGNVVDTIVELRNLRRLKLAALDAPDTHEQRGAETRALADTIETAYARWQKSPAVAELGAHLGRGQRTPKEWLAGLDTLVRGGGNQYRVAAVTPDVLTEVTRDAQTSTDARIGAATALLRLGDQAHRSTVRIAAEACAEPRLRVALLELVEADEDEELEKVLARVR